ncbi:MAG TPA: hypothetical protein VF595_03650, partial [Tepidisphaeraceae bacterium]
AMYSAENKGYGPYGDTYGGTAPKEAVRWDSPTGTGVSLAPVQKAWLWFDTLSILMDRRYNKTGSPGAVAGTAGNLAEVVNAAFIDVDTVSNDTVNKRRVSHYTAHPRIMPKFEASSKFEYVPTLSRLNIRKITSIKRSSEVFAIWDGPQQLDSQTQTSDPDLFGSAVQVAVDIDDKAIQNGTGLYSPAKDAAYNSRMDEPAHLGRSPTGPGSPPTLANLRLTNRDVATPDEKNNVPAAMRFRHVRNEYANFLALDGHVESRKIGSVLKKELCVPR